MSRDTAGDDPQPTTAAERRARYEAARPAARAATARSLDLLVATHTTVAETRRLIAHAVPDFGPLAPTAGLTLCDLLAGDEVLVVPDLQWADVATEHRCPQCSQLALSGSWA